MFGMGYSSAMGYSYYTGMSFPRIGTINYFNNNYFWGTNLGYSTVYSYYNGRVGYAVY